MWDFALQHSDQLCRVMVKGEADLQVEVVSSSWAASPQMQATMSVLQLPPKESFSTCVSLEER